MTEKEFLNNILNGTEDLLARFLDLLEKLNAEYCVIGGLAVNAYAEPVVSLDLDVVIALEELDKLIAISKNEFKVEKYPHRVNLSHGKSDLRIQLCIPGQTCHPFRLKPATCSG